MTQLPLAAACLLAALASFAVLAWAGVGRPLFALQGLSVALAVLLAVGSGWAVRRLGRGGPVAWGLISLVLLALPPVWADALPARWLRLGPVSLYLAPLVLPVLLVLAAPWLRSSDRQACVLAALLGAQGVALAAQPDAAQALAWTLAVGVLFASQRPPRLAWGIAGLPLVGALAWAAVQPDPLQPVPHVEQVFALAWAASPLAGAAVAGAALSVLLAFVRCRHAAGGSLAVLYGAQWVASLADLTPAPLMGYGASPWLGLGLVLGAVWASHRSA